MKPAMPEHYIADLNYDLDFLECACGVKMKARPDDFDQVYPYTYHRRSLGLSTKSLGNNPIRKGRLGDPER